MDRRIGASTSANVCPRIAMHVGIVLNCASARPLSRRRSFDPPDAGCAAARYRRRHANLSAHDEARLGRLINHQQNRL